MNPNDNSAEIYDIVYNALKPQSLTEEEITLITSRIDKGSRILDVGGGTGRHAIILKELGYNIEVVDSSPGMLRNLKNKAEAKGLDIKLIYDDILNVKLKINEYDMVIMFWNSFNEIALNHKRAIKLLSILKKSLKDSGSILINIDDSSKIDPSKFNFNTARLLDGREYRVHWETVEFHKKSNTSVSREQIVVFNNQGEALSKTDSFIKQRYWSLQEIRSICKSLGLEVSKIPFKNSTELYLEITKKFLLSI